MLEGLGVVVVVAVIEIGEIVVCGPPVTLPPGCGTETGSLARIGDVNSAILATSSSGSPPEFADSFSVASAVSADTSDDDVMKLRAVSVLSVPLFRPFMLDRILTDLGKWMLAF